ncbi:group I truncated hemoglobin [Shewanella sp. OMA3-2]|uniref:group I truncated hemoglobin n=1 Tax=Shewanella sp. OMA3-2 TaxID=2908650 RepID=UPI001F3D6BDD|nr:group 1 truncated hemoglobin [Shewanella sp. OMA3-2]UJF22370.1 group 1 truncated hemoglobin [Shewanella sp. OMA3-2]
MRHIGMMLVSCILLVTCLGCSIAKPSSNLLYQRLGGYHGLELIADDLLQLISQDERIVGHFRETDISIFKQRLVEHLCVVSGGGCDYQGESMLNAHQGLNISQADFDAIVGHLTQAMQQNDIPIQTRNALLAKLAPMYGDITNH